MASRDGESEEATGQNGALKVSEQPKDDAPALRLRLLCPHALVPALIGKKGENIKRIRRESGAAVSVADAVMGCDERVVHITGESIDEESSSAAADALCGVFESICSLQQARRGEGLAGAAAPPAPPPPPSAEPAEPAADEVAGQLSGLELQQEAAAAPAAAEPTEAEAAPPPPAAAAAAANGAGGGSEGEGGASSSVPSSPSAAGTAATSGSQAQPTGGPHRPQEARMLVESSLVGFIVGKGGSTIRDTMARTGAGVRILPKGDLPACASMGDEVVRVNGEAEAVAAALRVLAQQIKTHPLQHVLAGGGGGSGLAGHSGGVGLGGGGGGGGPMMYHPHHAAHGHAHPMAGHPQMHPGMHQGPPPGAMMMPAGAHPAELAYMHHPAALAAGYFPPGAGAGMMGPYSGTAVEVTFRLLAPVARTGNIIGKGGEHVRRVRSETGARIKVFDPAPGSEERVVALTSSEDALSPYCAAQDALIRCIIALTADDAPNAQHRVRLLTAQASVGMVLGKRGATVSQLRHETGASIKVLPTDPVPPAFGGGLGSEDAEDLDSSGGSVLEEVIQVEGSVQQCVAALRGVATLLRGWQIRRLLALQQQQYGGMAAAAAAAMQQMHHHHQQHQHQSMAQPVPMSPTAGSVMSPGSPGMMGLHLPSTLSSPAQPGSFMAAMMNGMQQHPPGHPPSGAGLMGGPPPPPPPPLPHQQQQQQQQQQPRGQQYVYHLTNPQVGAVLGKGGTHIAQIRNMSGARVHMQGEIEGGGRVLHVAGQPEQCHAAHNVVNAFLSMGRCEPAFPEPI